MPKTRELTNPATVDEPDGITALAEYSRPSGAVEELPDPPGVGGPWVGCAEEKTGNIAELRDNGIKPGDFYLSDGGSFTRLDPFQFHLVDWRRFYTRMAADGSIETAIYEEHPDLDEHYVGLVVAIVGDRLVPTRSEFRKTKSPTLTHAARTLYEASQTSWAQKSEAHKVSAACPIPWARFVATATTAQKTARKSGFKYFAARASVKPSDTKQCERVMTAAGDKDFVAAFREAADNFRERCEYLESLI